MTSDDGEVGKGSFWTKPHWQAVGAITGILALLLTFAVYKWQQDDGKEQAPSGPRQQVENGNCNVQGSNVDLDCVNAPTPQSIEKLDFSWQGGSVFLFNGPASALPKPPDYPASEIRGHCDEWLKWMTGQAAVYATLPGVMMSLQAGSPDILTVNSVSAMVTRKERPRKDRVYIKCQYGAGGDAGFYIKVNTTTGTTEVTDNTTQKRGVMPPFSIKLQGQDSSSVWIRVNSQSGFLYAGRLSASLIFNGRTFRKVFGFGDNEGVFRWVGGEDFDASIPAYDWDVAKQKWVRVADVPPGQEF
ncbi:MAG TPA: hypothetical protein VE465_08560 [Streptosporangiaceae bacterium]|nr:hypothetical protein [Streptosporangiaceae bacterium]